MRLGVRQREGGPPGAAEHLPAFDPEVATQELEVGDQVPGRVETQVGCGVARVRRRLAASALIEQDDPVPLGIEETPVPGRRAAAGAAVQEDDGLALRVARLLPVDPLPVADQQLAALVGLDRRVEDVVELGDRHILTVPCHPIPSTDALWGSPGCVRREAARMLIA